MTDIVLDPNVIAFALRDWDCVRLLERVQRSLFGGRSFVSGIARDAGTKLREEYERWVEICAQNGLDTLDTLFLQEMLDRWDNWSVPKPDTLPEEASCYLDGTACGEHEAMLIALAANKNVVLVVVRPGATHATLQERAVLGDGCRTEKLRREHLPDLHVRDAEDAWRYLHYQMLSKRFEGKVRGWIDRQYHYPNVKLRAKLGFVLTGGGGEIDILGRDDMSNPQRVLVCECKLKLPQAAGDLIDETEVTQLATNYQLVKEQEALSAQSEGRSDSRVFAMLVTNAAGLTEDAWTAAIGCRAEVWQARLPEDWDKYADWDLAYCQRLRRPKAR